MPHGFIVSLASYVFMITLSLFSYSLQYAEAVALGEPNTALYYLIELQRRFDKTCNGVTLPEAPTLIPSETLRAIALEHAQTNASIEQLLDKNGIAYKSFLMLHTPEAQPKAAFNSLKGIQCESIMGPYNEIGAEVLNGLWWVLMVERIPGKPVTKATNTDANLAPGTAGDANTTPVAHGEVDDNAGREAMYAKENGLIPPVAIPLLTDIPDVTPDVKVSVPTNDPNVTPLNDQNIPVPDNYQEGKLSYIPERNTAPYTTAPNTASNASGIPPQAQGVNQVYPITPTGDSMPSGTEKEDMLNIINSTRTRPNICGNMEMPAVTKIKPNSILESETASHSKDMAARNYLSASTPEGINAGQRVITAGYKWEIIGTLLAQGHPTPQNAMNDWMAKPENCQRIMNPAFTDIGIGYAPEKKIWTIIFASPIPDGALYIHQ